MSARGDSRESRALATLQQALETVHAVRSDHRVEDFLLSDESLAKMGLPPPRAEEHVLVVEEPEAFSLGVYLAPRVLETLRGGDPARLFSRSLPTLCLAIEGVSHFVYLTLRAAADRPVSLLELEVQAEVDKFVLAALHLWRQGQRHRVPGLLQRLFDDVRYLPHLDEEESERYRKANRLARSYCQELLPWVEAGRVEPLLAELRHAYRLGGGAKYGHLSRALH